MKVRTKALRKVTAPAAAPTTPVSSDPEIFQRLGGSQQGSQNRAAAGIVTSLVGIDDQCLFRIMVVFQRQINHCRNRVFDIAGRTESRANDPTIRILQPLQEGVTQQRIVLGPIVFKDGCFKGTAGSIVNEARHF